MHGIDVRLVLDIDFTTTWTAPNASAFGRK